MTIRQQIMFTISNNHKSFMYKTQNIEYVSYVAYYYKTDTNTYVSVFVFVQLFIHKI